MEDNRESGEIPERVRHCISVGWLNHSFNNNGEG